jgi:23S rRNA pseudouridine955/2504/2580 synthase
MSDRSFSDAPHGDAGATGVQMITITMDEADSRVDKWLKRRHSTLTQGQVEKLLRKGNVRVDGKRVKSNFRLQEGQVVRVPPLVQAATATARTTAAAATPRDADVQLVEEAILFENADLLVLNKPSGLAVQGGSKTIRHLDAILPVLRPDDALKLVHRLDKDTSGVLVVAKGAAAAAQLTRAFRDKDARKTYWAICVGTVDQVRLTSPGRLDAPLLKMPGVGGEKMAVHDDGQDASTLITVQDTAVLTGENAGITLSWLALSPLTGRTHQLRAHCAYLGCPILGDGKYGGKQAFLPDHQVARTLHLHARCLQLPAYAGLDVGKDSFTAAPPLHMRATADAFSFHMNERS